MYNLKKQTMETLSKQTIKRLVSLLSQIQESREWLDELISERSDYYDSRSEAWQDSENANLYCEATDYLEDLRDELEQIENFDLDEFYE